MIYLLDVAKIVTIPLISKALGLPRAICYSGVHFGPCKIRYSEEKTNEFVLSFSRFFVTLQEFLAFLCIKAVWGIDENLGYELATVLNSTFCYKLHQRTPEDGPPAILWLHFGCKGTT